MNEDTAYILRKLKRIESKVDTVLQLLQLVLLQEAQMANTLDDALAEISQESTLEDSILAIVTNLQAQVAAAGGNQAKIDAVFAAAQANVAKLTAAVTANTPAASVDTKAAP